MMNAGIVLLALLQSVVTVQGDTLPVIQATGEAQVSVMPDQATVFFDVEGHGVEVQEAAAALDSLVSAARGAVASVLGADGLMIPWGYKAGSNPLVPRVYGPGRAMETNLDNVAVAGFQTDVPDLDALARLITALTEAGIRQVVGALYTHSDLARIEADLTTEAVRDATRRATAIAEGLGAPLGPVIHMGPSRSFDQAANQMTQWLGYGGQQLNIAPRDIRIRVRVEGQWHLKQ